MTALKQCIVAEYTSMEEADVALQVLETANFSTENVSIVHGSAEQHAANVPQLEDQASGKPQADSSAGMGGVAGGTLGAALGAATLIGPFMVVGPLIGAAAGAGAAGLLGATRQWGVGTDDSRSFEQRVRDGSVLIIVVDRTRRLNEAERLLKTTKFHTVQRYGE
ncbi:DUF1269 domain-containing protein [Roseimaritima sediminicola]|uniref:DUF1269 domain-containing protein n=1 Tax=Roseimaritima sediminicola TaxID=2662066 RepID=UPI0012982E15|nr:DUF1269 domain-containing protein [Roseimaritima sediminicola]